MFIGKMNYAKSFVPVITRLLFFQEDKSGCYYLLVGWNPEFTNLRETKFVNLRIIFRIIQYIYERAFLQKQLTAT